MVEEKDMAVRPVGLEESKSQRNAKKIANANIANSLFIVHSYERKTKLEVEKNAMKAFSSAPGKKVIVKKKRMNIFSWCVASTYAMQ